MTNKLAMMTSWVVIIAMVAYPISPVFAIEAPTAPSEPVAPDTAVAAPVTTLDAPSEPEAPTAPENTSEASAPRPEAPTYQQAQDNSVQNQSDEEGDTNDEVDGAAGSSQPSSQTTTQPLQQTTSQDGKVGETKIDTGDALANGTIVSSINTNSSGGGSAQVSGQPGVSIANTDNGSGSQNNGSASISSDTTTVQDNSAHVSSGLTQDATTGDNSGSNNVGNTTISTGDANSTGTLLTTVNTNTDGITISEFNIVDDHVGDVVLDFAANCIVGCGGGDVAVQNTGNGSDSANTAGVDSATKNETFQNNDAVVENEMVLSADSGTNTADANTGGDTSVETGDANIAANAVTFANNNIAGNVVIGVVNIFGNLLGDILFPESTPCCGSGATAANTANGSNTTNNATLTTENTDKTFQTNDATIANNILFDATTGDNSASGNTGGDTQIATGDTSLDANVLNVANSNVSGGDWWLVLVNEAGNWVGKIVGAADGALFAGSDGTDFKVNENGVITAVNNGNGSGSQNSTGISSTNNDTTVQNNNADITNNLKLSANTGGNSTSDNTGGNNSIKTGDANIIANLVNFVNNNITGDGKLFVTVVNVFGNWMGDFVTPGHKKEQQTQNLRSTQQAETNNEAKSANQPNVGGVPSNNDGGNTSSPTSTQTSESKNTVNNTLVPSSSTQTEKLAQVNPGIGIGTTSNTSVKGASVHIDDTLENQVKNKSIRINLAWLLVLIPVLLAGTIGRKFILAKLLPRK